MITFSPDGRFLAFGSSDLSIGILDATTLIVRARFLHKHPSYGLIAYSNDPQSPRVSTYHY